MGGQEPDARGHRRHGDAGRSDAASLDQCPDQPRGQRGGDRTFCRGSGLRHHGGRRAHRPVAQKKGGGKDAAGGQQGRIGAPPQRTRRVPEPWAGRPMAGVGVARHRRCRSARRSRRAAGARRGRRGRSGDTGGVAAYRGRGPPERRQIIPCQ